MRKCCVAKWLVVVCAVSAVFTGCGGAKLTCGQVSRQLAASTNQAIVPAPRQDNQWWLNRQEALNEKVQKGNVDLLMIGDSITHGWEGQPELWESYFGRWNPVNLGIGGDRTEQVLWRLDNGNLEGIHPKVAVVMIGTNNSNGNDHTAEEIAEGIEAIICKLRSRLPQTKILLLSIFPRGSREQMADKTMNGTFNSQWAKNDKASLLASQLADGKSVVYLDINDVFLTENGVLTRDIMPDLLHLSAEGYTLWGEAITPTLEELMAD